MIRPASLPRATAARLVLALAFLLATLNASAEGTGASLDLAAGRPVGARGGASGNTGAVTGNAPLPDGFVPGPGSAAVLPGPDAALVIDLGRAATVRFLGLQADRRSGFVVDGSADGQTWEGLVRVEPFSREAVLRSVWVELPRPTATRYLGIRPEGTSSPSFVSSLHVFEERPDPWPPGGVVPASAAAASKKEGDWDDSLVALKGAIAAAGALVLLWGAGLERRGRAAVFRSLRDSLLALFALLAAWGWFNFGRFHDGPFIHTWDAFHYYLGSKYFPEVGYSGLYEATVAFDLDEGREAEVRARRVRDLSTNRLEPGGAVVAKARARRSAFTSGRWEAFRTDAAFFRAQLGTARWAAVHSDHGYNATPVWGIAGALLASTGPATPSQLGLLAALDPIQLATAGAVGAWAFGWRAMAVAVIFWGTNYPARFWWTGGAFLRTDWLLLLVLGVSLLRKGRPGSAGAALATATLLRVFPGVVFLGLALRAGMRILRERRLRVEREELRILAGAALAAAFLLPLSALVAGGGRRLDPAAFSAFIANSRKHLETPLTNNVGLVPLVAFDPATRGSVTVRPGAFDPWGRWKASRMRFARERRVLAGLAASAILILAAFASRRREAWEGTLVGLALLPAITTLTSYYAAALVPLGFLWTSRRSSGVLLATGSAATCLAPLVSTWNDERYAFVSAVLVTTALGALVSLARAVHPPPSGRSRPFDPGRPAPG